MQLHTLFNPRSVAIIGASNNPTKLGHILMQNILAGGTREVYPISLTETEILGHATHTSVRAVAGHVDLAVIAVKAPIVASVLRECAEKHVGAAVVISSGFRESGEEGAVLETELATIAREHDMTLLGPNSAGVVDTRTDWQCTLLPTTPPRGGVALVTQSDSLGTTLYDWAARAGVGISKFIDVGNESALSVAAVLEHLAEDPNTHSVLLYLEQVQDGDALLQAVASLTKKKPVAYLRTGMTAPGADIIARRMGTHPPDDAVFAAALRKGGATPVESMRTFISIGKLFALGVRTATPRVAVLGNGSGPSINAADLLSRPSSTLSLAPFSEDLLHALQAQLPPGTVCANPLDLSSSATTEAYTTAAELVRAESDVTLFIVTPQPGIDTETLAAYLVETGTRGSVVPVIMGGATLDPIRTTLLAHSIPSFEVPSDVLEALDALGNERATEHVEAPQAAEAVQPSTPLEMYPLEEMAALLQTYGLPLSGTFLREKGDIARALKKAGEGPYVLKAVARTLAHRKDLGALRLSLSDSESIEQAWDAILESLATQDSPAAVDGMLLQHEEEGIECVIRMKRDPAFGPVVQFGLSGTLGEVMEDTTMHVVPVAKADALEMIRAVKGYPLLEGVNEHVPADIDALAEVITSLSQLALEYPEIEEVHFDPIFALTKGACIVDAQVLRKAPEPVEVTPEPAE